MRQRGNERLTKAKETDVESRTQKNVKRGILGLKDRCFHLRLGLRNEKKRQDRHYDISFNLDLASFSGSLVILEVLYLIKIYHTLKTLYSDAIRELFMVPQRTSVISSLKNHSFLTII